MTHEGDTTVRPAAAAAPGPVAHPRIRVARRADRSGVERAGDGRQPAVD